MSKKAVKNPALGPYEAACLAGVHWTRIRVMAERGEVNVSYLRSRLETDRIRVYSMSSVNANWHAYEDALAGGRLTRRQRANAHMRPLMLAELGKIRDHIEFDDAIGSLEAAEILGVYPTFLHRLTESGKIIGRKLISHREGSGRSAIYSRKSCIANAEEAKKAYRLYPGRPRHAI